MKIFSRIDTAIKGWHSASNIQNEKSTKPSSNIHSITNSPHELKTLKPSQQATGMVRESSTSSKRFFGQFIGTKLSDISHSPAAKSNFSQINSLYGGQKSEPYKALDRYLNVPDKIALMDVNIRERKTTPTETEVTVSWSQTSPAYYPLDSEKTLSGMSVSVPLLEDLSRANYIIELPGLDGNLIELKTNMSDEEKIAHLYGIFGEENTKIISGIAHQGHMAEFAGIGLSMCNKDYIIAQGDAAPQFIISKQEDGSCRITSSLTFGLKSITQGNIIDGLSLEMIRTNVLHPTPNNNTNLRSGAGEEKDGMSFKVKYVSPDAP